MTDATCLRRRSVMRMALGGAAAFAGASGQRARAEPHGPRETTIALTGATLDLPTPDLANPAVMVAGPADAAAGQWAELLARPLAQALHPGGRLAFSVVGGRDGVTGANAFEALANPDGSTALLVPGAAAVAWLAGDPRVHFDAGRWVPVLTSLGSAVLLGRTGPRPATLRVAVSTTSGVELPALLGLSLLGQAPVPVFGLSDPDDAYAALLNGRVDAIVLTGPDVPRRTAALSSPRLRPIFSFGGDASGALRDPMLKTVPTLPELFRVGFGREPAGALFEAWKAAAAAARLHAALVLQPLTPASLVAQWRRACASAITDPALARVARAAQITPLPSPGCVPALSAIVADETTQLALRRWIASHSDWRPA